MSTALTYHRILLFHKTETTDCIPIELNVLYTFSSLDVTVYDSYRKFCTIIIHSCVIIYVFVILAPLFFMHLSRPSVYLLRNAVYILCISIEIIICTYNILCSHHLWYSLIAISSIEKHHYAMAYFVNMSIYKIHD